MHKQILVNGENFKKNILTLINIKAFKLDNSILNLILNKLLIVNYINNNRMNLSVDTQLHKINHKKNIRKYKLIIIKEYMNNNLLKIKY